MLLCGRYFEGVTPTGAPLAHSPRVTDANTERGGARLDTSPTPHRAAQPPQSTPPLLLSSSLIGRSNSYVASVKGDRS